MEEGCVTLTVCSRIPLLHHRSTRHSLFSTNRGRARFLAALLAYAGAYGDSNLKCSVYFLKYFAEKEANTLSGSDSDN